jgi:hypothetical protein
MICYEDDMHRMREPATVKRTVLTEADVRMHLEAEFDVTSRPRYISEIYCGSHFTKTIFTYLCGRC